MFALAANSAGVGKLRSSVRRVWMVSDMGQPEFIRGPVHLFTLCAASPIATMPRLSSLGLQQEKRWLLSKGLENGFRQPGRGNIALQKCYHRPEAPGGRGHDPSRRIRP